MVGSWQRTIEDKAEIARKIIEDAISFGKSCVAFSGGKDSTVVLHLARQVDKDIVAQWTNTGVESSETVKFCRSIPNLVELHPEKTFWQCIDEFGWPVLKEKVVSDSVNCCYWLKKKPGFEWAEKEKMEVVITGMTAAESRVRAHLLARCGPLYIHKETNQWRCHPIYDWSEREVWDYIKDNNIPYNEAYDHGCRRVGCLPCTAYKNWQGELYRTNPQMYAIVVKKRSELTKDGTFGCKGLEQDEFKMNADEWELRAKEHKDGEKDENI